MDIDDELRTYYEVFLIKFDKFMCVYIYTYMSKRFNWRDKRVFNENMTKSPFTYHRLNTCYT